MYHFKMVLIIGLFLSSGLLAGNDAYKLPAGTSIYQLDNGLQVLLIENPLLPMVGVNVVVKAGSGYETFSTSGMSHMLEHLLFNGTTTRTQKELYDAVDLIGGYNNANTSYFYTNFMMVTPAEHVGKGMEIQADMLFYSLLPEDKFEKEKGIVLEEIAQSLAKPSAQLERNIYSILYSGHAISLPVLGTYTTIQSMNRDYVYNYYKNVYVPNNMIMSVIGNFKADSILTLINNIYGKAKPANINLPETNELKIGFDLLDKRQNENHAVYHRFYSGEDRQVQIFYLLPGQDKIRPAYFELFDEALKKNTDELKSYLDTSFPGLIKSVEMSSIQNPIKNYFEINITLSNRNNIESLISKADAFVKKMQFILSPETIELFATKAKTDFLKNLEKPHMFGIYNAQIFAEGGIESVLASYAAEYYLKGGQWVNALKITTNPLVIIQNPQLEFSIGNTGGATNDKLFTDSGSGLTVIARQNPASELVAIHVLFKHKAKYEAEFGNEAAKYLHDCFGQRLETNENKKITSKFGLTHVVNDNPYIPMDNIYLHPDFGYIRFEGLANDLPGLFSFINRELNDFRPTQEEFNKAKTNFMRSSMMMASGTAQKIFEEKYKNVVYEDEQYPESGSMITFENLLKFSESYFTTENMIISVVTPVGTDSVFKLIMSGKWRLKPGTDAPEPYERSLRLTTKTIQDKTEEGGEQSYLFWGYVKEIKEEEKPALEALSLLLMDTIIFDIREKQGRAYRMSAGIEQVKNRALFYVRLGTRPDNIDPLLTQMSDFFNIEMLGELTEKKLQKSINMYLGRMMFRRLSSINQAYYLANSYYFHTDMHYDQSFLDQLKKVTPEQVQDVARKYLDFDNSVTVIVQ